MPGYRFCRSDDIPLLVAAHNACWVPHFGPEQAITVEGFKRGIRELGLWSSSCMVAFDGDEPIGVLLGAKRDGDANCVYRLAVKPGWERQGHGRHLLTSLADKAAILGPPRLVAEIPAEWAAIRAFFEKSTFLEEARYAEFTRPVGVPPSAAQDPRRELIVPIGLDELVESGAFDPRIRRPWSRSLASLRAKGETLAALAVATDRVEAYVAFVAGAEVPEVWALGTADAEAGPSLLELLLARVQPAAGMLRIAPVSDLEMSWAVLASLGFRRERETIGYVVDRG